MNNDYEQYKFKFKVLVIIVLYLSYQLVYSIQFEVANIILQKGSITINGFVSK